MIIGIDGNEANVREKVGVSVYTTELLTYFQKKAEQDLQIIVFLRHPPTTRLPKETSFYRYEIVNGPVLWSQVFLPLRLFLKRNIDVFFSPAHYSPRYCPVPLVVTIHDLAFFYYPNEFLKQDLYKLKNWTSQSVKKAKCIVAVSKNTKKDILKYYDLPAEKIAVVYNGFEKTAQKQTPSSFAKKPYVLFTGTLQPRKNITLLIRSFADFSKLHKDYSLVIAGKKGWLYEQIFKDVTHLGMDSKVIFTDYVSDSELIGLYKNAEFFVMPSLYEGFGVPVLEALSYGCPVISSFSSSLPEVAGDASLYFDPTDAKDLTEKMILLTENKNLRKDLVAKGKEQLKKFSWQKCAEETLAVIKNAA